VTRKKHFHPTFYFTINSLLILLILSVGGILTWQNYQITKKIVLSDADQFYDQVSREVSMDFKNVARGVFQVVRHLSSTPVTRAFTLDQRLQQLGLLSSFLEDVTEISAIQVGYENGDYFIIRPIRTDRVGILFNAPVTATYVVDNIAVEPATGRRMLLRLYYDRQLTEIARSEPVATEYDPRQRSWYKQAQSIDTIAGVEPYLFYFLKEIGTTISYKPPGKEAVIAVDVTIEQISETLKKHLLTPRSEIAFIAPNGQILGYNRPDELILRLNDQSFRIAEVSDLKSGVLYFIQHNNLLKTGPLEFSFNGESWLGNVRIINITGIKKRDNLLIMVSPKRELLADAIKTIERSLLTTLIMLLTATAVATLLAMMISRKLKALSREAVSISRFDFARPITIRSKVKEVDELAMSMDLMKNTISRFLSLVRSLADEQNFDLMLQQITRETMNVSQAGGVITFLADDDAKILKPGVLCEQSRGLIDCENLPILSLNSDNRLLKVVQDKEIRHILLSPEQNESMGSLLALFAVDKLMVTALPLQNRHGEVIGLLCLLNRVVEGKEESETWEERLDFVRTFSGFAAVSLESRQLFEMQKRLMDSFMHLMAGAIDSKSPYTGGHCQRVPVLTKMIARAASEDTGHFKEYKLDDEGWEALHLGGWMHDCGKVTTPEYVVDKATKLETIYNRIHEIRTRFEVLKRDAEIRYWEGVAAGGDKEKLRTELKKEWAALDDDFTFIAECNLGGEFMAPEKIERLEKIANRTWKRTLDDRIGISWEEERRKAKEPKPALPVEEPLIADRRDHLIERNENEKMPVDNPWGFKLDVPEYKYNLGELYNLKVERGTLTAEERYKINDHIVQTIIMLEKLPYPKHLKRVPEFAGGHHETLDGTGYPRRLTSEKMSLSARMMAIADIFEALTASDRPYKKAKKLSEAVQILYFFKQDRHIDSDLFDLFLQSGVYLEYAREYLDPEQIDGVDIKKYIG